MKKKKSGSRKCTTALVLYKGTSKNHWQWSAELLFSYHRHFTAAFYWLPFRFLVRCEEPRKTGCTVCLVRTARNTQNCAPQGVTEKVLPVYYCSVARFLLRSQQVQNKVTTRFNKLIYILFKDVQCTFCLIQGFRESRNFYLHIYRSQTAVMSADAGKSSRALHAALWMLRTQVKYI